MTLACRVSRQNDKCIASRVGVQFSRTSIIYSNKSRYSTYAKRGTYWVGVVSLPNDDIIK